MSPAPRRRILLAPSILSADFGRLAEEVRAAEEAGADWIHVDVLPVDVHLMIESPERDVGAFVDAGADSITVHQETCPHLDRHASATGVAPARTPYRPG